MAGEVVASQVVGKVKADISDLKSKYATAKEETNSLKSSIVGTLKSIGSQGLGTLMGFAGFQGLNSIGGLLSNIFGSDEQLQNTTTAFTKLLGSSKAAKDEIASLQQFAAKTPLQFKDVAAATQSLLGYGFKLKDTQGLITAIGDALAATGHLDPATLQQVVTVFGQMHASVTLHTQDLQQLASVGINAFQLLADNLKPTNKQIQELVKQGLIPAGDAHDYLTGKTKLTVAEIQQLVTDGLIPSQQGIQALTDGIEKNPIYKGGMALQSQTTAGKISTLKDNLTLAAETMSKPIFDEIGKIIGKLGDAVASPAFQQFAKTVGQDIAGAIQTTITVTKDIVGWFIQWHQPIIDVGAAITVFFLPAIIKSGLQALISSEQIAQNFVVSIISSGKQAIIAAGRLWFDGSSWGLGVKKSGEAAKDAATQVDTLADSEEAVGTKAEASTELETLATAEQAIGDEAEGSIAKVDGLAASEDNLGKSSTAAAGAAGAGGLGGFGVMGLLAAVVYFGDYLTMKVPSDWVSSHAVDWLKSLGNNANDAADGVQNLTQQLPKLSSQLTDLTPLMKFNDDMLGLGTTLENDYLNTLSLADALHRLNMQEYNYMTGNGYGSNDNPTIKHKPHAQGGFVGPNEMLSLINDQGGRGELVHLPGGSYVYPHNQSVAMLQGMGAGGNAELLTEMRAIRALLAGGAAATYNVLDANQLQQMQTRNAQRNQALYGRR